jgi:hypothetical protein
VLLEEYCALRMSESALALRSCSHSGNCNDERKSCLSQRAVKCKPHNTHHSRAAAVGAAKAATRSRRSCCQHEQQTRDQYGVARNMGRVVADLRRPDAVVAFKAKEPEDNPVDGVAMLSLTLGSLATYLGVSQKATLCDAEDDLDRSSFCPCACYWLTPSAGGAVGTRAQAIARHHADLSAQCVHCNGRAHSAVGCFPRLRSMHTRLPSPPPQLYRCLRYCAHTHNHARSASAPGRHSSAVSCL